MKISMISGAGDPSGAVQKVKPEAQMVERAHDVKMSATESWMRGHITAKERASVHKRCDSVIKAKGRVK